MGDSRLDLLIAVKAQCLDLGATPNQTTEHIDAISLNFEADYMPLHIKSSSLSNCGPSSGALPSLSSPCCGHGHRHARVTRHYGSHGIAALRELRE